MKEYSSNSASRRAFLKATLVAGIAPQIIPSHVLGLNSKISPSNKITLGVLGAGARGTADLVNFLGLDDVRVTTLCDVNQRNIAKAKTRIADAYGKADVKIFSDFKEFNADPSIDAVLMALPVHWHSIPSLDAILNGKHIFHEKPMAMSHEEAKRVQKAVKKKGVVFQFGTQQRSELKFRWACELALNGRLGKLKEIQVAVPGGFVAEDLPTQPVPGYVDYERWIGPAPITDFNETKLRRHYHENMKNFSLGMISCWGIHHLDIAQWLASQYSNGPTQVEGSGNLPSSGSCDAILNWDVEFKYDNAPPIKFVGPPPDKKHGLRFIGEDDSLFVTRGSLEADLDLQRDPQNKVGTMPIKLPVSTHHEGNFIEAIKNGNRAIYDIDTAIQSDILCQIAHIAVKTGRKLKWDSKKEHFRNDKGANDLLKQRKFRGDWKLAKV
ncbi:MAG: Gfo/Idh/MocA family oxidoreductase [Opitutales bacterium]|nr:Gfo/Idh/MocA family oxidoreductase [Opitutales bacterium]